MRVTRATCSPLLTCARLPPSPSPSAAALPRAWIQERGQPMVNVLRVKFTNDNLANTSSIDEMIDSVGGQLSVNNGPPWKNVFC